MASSSKQNWQLGDAGILRKKEDEDELLVFGYSCKLFRDDEKALYIDQGKHLIPWMGDDTLKIDRYDGRGTLYDLKQYEPLPGGYDESLWVGLSDSERHVEHLCNEERYRALHHNEDEEALYQDKPVRVRRQFQSDPSCCPACGVTVRPSELRAHLAHELDKLGRLGGGGGGRRHPPPPSRDTLLRVRANRTGRSCGRCPVCNASVGGGLEGLSRHVERCLRGGEEEEVVVDGDEGQDYGPRQYSEVDVVPTKAEGPAEEAERSALREAVIGAPIPPSSSPPPPPPPHHGDGNHVLGALRSRLQELESAMPARCPICLGRYVHPVISLCCWHVYCEQCWLRGLGAHKLCPQCKSIVSPSDLRKIYI